MVLDMDKKSVLLAFVFVFLSMSMFGKRLVITVSGSTIHHVYPGESIQDAINSAQSGDTIIVHSGTYYEHVVVDKTISLIGEDKYNTIIDGYGISVSANDVHIEGFTVRRGVVGIHLDNSNGSTISGNIITLNEDPLFGHGIWVDGSFHNTITNNVITENAGAGIALFFLFVCTYNTVYANTISNNSVGIGVGSSNNTIYANTISNNAWAGIELADSPLAADNNTIYHNNFINNYNQVYSDETNFWDNGEGEGNYWSDYAGLDDGTGGRVAGDGVGDTNLPHQGVDYYPLTTPWGPIPIVWDSTTYPVTLLSNSTISEFHFIQANKRISFDIRGPSGTVGYCNVTIPRTLLRDNPWTVLLDTMDITAQTTVTENETHTSLYFTYTHGTYRVQIIGTWVVPEFPASIILPLFMILTLCAAVLRKIKV